MLLRNIYLTRQCVVIFEKNAKTVWSGVQYLLNEENYGTFENVSYPYGAQKPL